MPTRRFYTLGQKRAILRQQRDAARTDSEIAREHDVTPIQIARWRAKLSVMIAKRASLKTTHPGYGSKYAANEGNLLRFISERRAAKRGKRCLA
jgi:transposase-like protein